MPGVFMHMTTQRACVGTLSVTRRCDVPLFTNKIPTIETINGVEKCSCPVDYPELSPISTL